MLRGLVFYVFFFRVMFVLLNIFGYICLLRCIYKLSADIFFEFRKLI